MRSAERSTPGALAYQTGHIKPRRNATSTQLPATRAATFARHT